uniref:NADH-ubiquinone oxidoreductase chain 5 n=1 Tax=Ophioplinthus gelida TaxID=696348 RepID=A0A3G2WK13_9ECHI|nr:NADH dehydrogenase subunit 5 [Ophioplinthus gelida]AYO99592.1 NADH dehydrogenase subunit 5 [Ophioplinthus gelida]
MLIGIISFTSLFLIVLYNVFNNYNKGLIQVLFNSSLISSLILLYWFITDNPSYIININWFYWNLNTISLSLIIDPTFILFSTIAIFVSWSIVEYSTYYMVNDPNRRSFDNILILFLAFMLILISSNNLFTLFIGWEGVGILSFILISWWSTRATANSSALLAIIYNRIGDSGLILFMAISLLNFNSLNLNEIIQLNNINNLPNIAILGIILAASGKSAQFILHPWLPAAMEGPTPVSALLHSSTMVVAGVFLLYRCSPLLLSLTWALPLICIIGAITALFAASSALFQYDIKKIIAYSTTSQLGLMIIALGINAPNLALFHICTHAFFKALLFLCSGSIIHSLNNEQDIRKMSFSNISLPLTNSCIIVGSLALCGLPFLAGYYSKDLILENSQNYVTNNISIIMALIATLFTAIYSLRLIYYLAFPNLNTGPLNPITEENSNLINPIIRLTTGVFCSGWALSLSTFNNLLINLPHINKLIPLLMTLSVISLIQILLTLHPLNNTPRLLSLFNFFSSEWYYNRILQPTFLNLSLNLSTWGVLRTLDQGWITLIGAGGISASVLQIIPTIQKTQSANISSYISHLSLFTLAFFLLINFY